MKNSPEKNYPHPAAPAAAGSDDRLPKVRGLLSKNRRATLFLYLSQYALFKESKLSGQQGQLGIDALLVQLFSLLGRMRESPDSLRPAWVNPLKEMLMDTPTDWTLVELAALNIYPVHLSREFPKHFLYNKR